MKTKSKKKLMLNKRSIAKMDNDSIERVKGGFTPDISCGPAAVTSHPTTCHKSVITC